MKKLYWIVTFIATIACTVAIGTTALYALTVINDCTDQREYCTNEYEELISDFNEDEMYILNRYGGYLAGFAYGFRSTVEEDGQIVKHEHMSVYDGIYKLTIDTANGDVYVYEFEKAN